MKQHGAASVRPGRVGEWKQTRSRALARLAAPSHTLLSHQPCPLPLPRLPLPRVWRPGRGHGRRRGALGRHRHRRLPGGRACGHARLKTVRVQIVCVCVCLCLCLCLCVLCACWQCASPCQRPLSPPPPHRDAHPPPRQVAAGYVLHVGQPAPGASVSVGDKVTSKVKREEAPSSGWGCAGQCGTLPAWNPSGPNPQAAPGCRRPPP